VRTRGKLCKSIRLMDRPDVYGTFDMSFGHGSRSGLLAAVSKRPGVSESLVCERIHVQVKPDTLTVFYVGLRIQQ
jgi:hypothetical protein